MLTRRVLGCSLSRWVLPSVRLGITGGETATGTGEPSTSTKTSISTDQPVRGRDPGRGAGERNGSITRSTGKGLPIGTRAHGTSIPRQTVQPWTAVRVN